MVRSYVRLIKWAISLSALLPLLTVYCSYLLVGTTVPLPPLPVQLLIFSGVVVLIVAAWVLFDRFSDAIENNSSRQGHFLDTFPVAYADAAIFLSAALSLFLELAVIRWQGAIFPVFAFYKNFALLSCFVGLGLGYALSSRGSIPLSLVVPSLAWQMVLLILLKNGMQDWMLTSIMVTPFSEQLTMGIPVAESVPHFMAIYSFLLVIFLLTAIAFLPVGQLCGRLMGRREKLHAYGLNLLGSLFGVLLMFGVSFLWTPPAVWFGVCFVALLSFQLFDIKTLFWGVCSALVSLLILVLPVSTGEEQIYSPYQLLERGLGERGLMRIRAAGHYYQRVHDLSFSNANRNIDNDLRHIADYYELPYKIYGKIPLNIAIVGAGTGNDVAAALRSGTGHIDAIEIDPAIQKLGKLYHPERPYDDPRVTSIINDARTFLRTSKDSYDMVVYGLLDSHTLLSHASSVRLDSFVYTVEGLREARSRLNEGGMLSLSFCVLSRELGRKIYLMMEEAFDGLPPVCVWANYDGSVIYMQKKEGGLTVPPDVLKATGFSDVTSYLGNPTVKADVSTDDWPFFYMPQRVYPRSYLVILCLVLLLSGLITFNFFGQQPVFSHPSYFFLGAGFMLIETKGITEMGLTFGNTWQVIGIVISGILLMAFLANVVVQRFSLFRPAVPFLLLLVSLATGFVIAGNGGLPSTNLGKVGTVAVLTCPLFFSGMVFSSLLGKSRNVASVMAVNLLGAMTGGILEYNSMYFGFRSLYLLAMILYLLAFISAHFMRNKLNA